MTIDELSLCRSHSQESVTGPSWIDVEDAIRGLNGDKYSAVCLHRQGDEPEDLFMVIGEKGRWTLMNSVGRWEFDDPQGGEEFVSIWPDMDFECKQRNLLTDLELVLAITRVFYDTCSYEALNLTD